MKYTKIKVTLVNTPAISLHNVTSLHIPCCSSETFNPRPLSHKIFLPGYFMDRQCVYVCVCGGVSKRAPQETAK